MPRIDPLQLLKCLSVLLTPEGGILSKEEVPRLVNLMTKFSKKLVSKCVYILILKNTETSLVNMFMAEGGWNLIHTWLQDAIQISNWDLVKEILSLLLATPVDVERLKLNTIPKLVKGLTRVDSCKGVQELSSQLVQDWLTIVKNNTATKVEPCQPVENVTNEIKTVDINSVNKIQESVEVPQEQQQPQLQAQQIEAINVTVDSSEIANDAIQNNGQGTISTNTFYKVTVRDGKQVISKTPGPENEQDKVKTETPTINDTVKSETKDKRDESSQKSKSNSSKSSSSKHSSSNSNKSSKSSSSSSSKHKSSSSKSSSRDKDRDKKDRDKFKDKHKSNGSKHSSSSSSSKEKSDSKEKQAEKDKDTLAKIKPQSIDKLGRIPKKTDDKTKEIKKPTMSIEVRKNTEERPKTVKIYNSKRRSTGLEDEAKPAPPRPVKKQATPATVPISTTIATATPSVIPPPKRQSPIRDLPIPPEKKLKFELPPPTERPGSIKLIPPKPKPPVLQESDIFMDALAASASTKKESKKRKRRPSVTKDTPSSPTKQQPQQETETPTSPTSSPLGLKNIAAPNFYQDTLDTEKTEEDSRDNDQDDDRVERGGGNTPTQNEEVEEKRTVDGLKGALMYTKRKGPKKSVRFNDNDLTQVRFFELDETERVNVTKPFMDMAKMEMTSEREALQLSRKLANEDVMEVQTNWRVPYLIDIPDPLVIPGCKSLEKDIQFAREKTALQALYFDKRKIPDSPDEPIPENHQMRDPIIIPLEDSETQEMDLRNTPWPEPKGSPPPPLLPDNNIPPQLFNNIQIPFQTFPNGPPQPFQGLPPRFPLGQGPQPIFGPPNMLPNGNMLGPPNLGPQHDLLHQGGPLNPNAFGPGPGPDFNPMMNDNFQIPFNPPNMNMFPPNNFNMNRPGNRGGPPGGGFRRGGGNNNGGWVRMNGGPGNWNNRGPSNNRSGGGGNNGRVCKNFKNHGFCRNMDKCPFVHPK